MKQEHAHYRPTCLSLLTPKAIKVNFPFLQRSSSPAPDFTLPSFLPCIAPPVPERLLLLIQPQLPPPSLSFSQHRNSLMFLFSWMPGCVSDQPSWGKISLLVPPPKAPVPAKCRQREWEHNPLPFLSFPFLCPPPPTSSPLSTQSAQPHLSLSLTDTPPLSPLHSPFSALSPPLRFLWPKKLHPEKSSVAFVSQ